MRRSSTLSQTNHNNNNNLTLIVRLKITKSKFKRYFVARMFDTNPEKLEEEEINKIMMKSRYTISLFKMCFFESFELGKLPSEKYFQVCRFYHFQPLATAQVIRNAVTVWNFSRFMHTRRGRELICNYTQMPPEEFQKSLDLLSKYKLVANVGPQLFCLPFKFCLSNIVQCVAEWRWIIWEVCNYRYSSRVENRAAESFKTIMEQTNARQRRGEVVSCHWLDAAQWWRIEREESFPLHHHRRLKSNRIVVWNAHLLSFYELERMVTALHELWQNTIAKRKMESYPIHICFTRDSHYRRGVENGEPLALDYVTDHLAERFAHEKEIFFTHGIHARAADFHDENVRAFEDQDVAKRYLLTGQLLGGEALVSGRISNISSPISFCKTNEFAKFFWQLYTECRMVFVSVTRNPTSLRAINSFVFDQKQKLGLLGAFWGENLFSNITYKKSDIPKTIWQIQSSGKEQCEAVSLHDSYQHSPSSIKITQGKNSGERFELAECLSYEELRFSLPYAVVLLDEFKHYVAEECMQRVDMYNLMNLVTVKLIFIGNLEEFPLLH